MPITRIGETQAKPELTEAISTLLSVAMHRLRDFPISITPMIKSSQG